MYKQLQTFLIVVYIALAFGAPIPESIADSTTQTDQAVETAEPQAAVTSSPVSNTTDTAPVPNTTDAVPVVDTQQPEVLIATTIASNDVNSDKIAANQYQDLNNNTNSNFGIVNDQSLTAVVNGTVEAQYFATDGVGAINGNSNVTQTNVIQTSVENDNKQFIQTSVENDNKQFIQTSILNDNKQYLQTSVQQVQNQNSNSETVNNYHSTYLVSSGSYGGSGSSSGNTAPSTASYDASAGQSNGQPSMYQYYQAVGRSSKLRTLFGKMTEALNAAVELGLEEEQ